MTAPSPAPPHPAAPAPQPSRAPASPPAAQPDLDLRLAAIAGFFDTMSLSDLPALDHWYTEDAWFKDPFNEVTGLPAIRDIFAHMYQRLDDPRFRVQERFGRDDQAVLTWTFAFRFKGETRAREIRGATHLRLAADGRIRWHRDYWDAAEELYEQLPLLGSLMRWLKRRASS